MSTKQSPFGYYLKCCYVVWKHLKWMPKWFRDPRVPGYLLLLGLTLCMYVSRQNCQWNQKGLLDAYRMRDGVAWCQSSAQWLVLGTSLNVRQMYLSGKPQLPDPKTALPGGYFVHFTEMERGDFQNTGILIYNLGFCLAVSFLKRGEESKNFLFISVHLTAIRLPLTLATAHAMLLVCRMLFMWLTAQLD